MPTVPADYPTESYSVVPDLCHADCPQYIRHVFVWPEAPVTMNAAHAGGGRWKVNDTIKQWRTAFRLMAAGCQRLAWATITVDHLTETRRKVDPVACAPTYKAALDGLRDWTDSDGRRHLGVLPDDGPDYVRRVVFNAPVHAGRDALVITLDGPAA